MRITEVRVDRLDLRTRGEATDGGAIGCVLVRLVTDAGIIGIGEAVPGVAYTGETADDVEATIRSVIAPTVIGRGTADIEAIDALWRRHMVGHEAARAAMEMALWDLRGHDEEAPVHGLLGAATSRAAPEAYPFDRIEAPDAAAARARSLVAQGVRAFKVYLSVGDPAVLRADREEVVAAVRDGAGPDVEIRVDANGGWPDTSTAVGAIKRLERSGINMIEEPVRGRDLEACRAIRARVSVPVCLDESVRGPEDATRAIRAEACDAINIKLMKTGGFLEGMRVASIAIEAGVAPHIGNMGHSTIGVAALLHLWAVVPTASTIDVDPPSRGGDLSTDIATGLRSDVDAGVMTWKTSGRPGLGVELDDRAVAAQRVSGRRASEDSESVDAEERGR
jgi:L-alanine-DL-glutamate epimerase-like enolase superfamily enzyme